MQKCEVCQGTGRVLTHQERNVISANDELQRIFNSAEINESYSDEIWELFQKMQHTVKQQTKQIFLDKIEGMKHNGDCHKLGCKMTYNQTIEDIIINLT